MCVPQTLANELAQFFVPHQRRLAELLRDKKIQITRFTDQSKANYVA